MRLLPYGSKHSYFFRNKREFCEGCSFMGLYDPAKDSCIICDNFAKNEDVICDKKFGKNFKYTPHVGYYLDTIEAISNLYQDRSSSGGLCTNLLQILLERKYIDYVLAVGFSVSQQSFQYFKIDSVEDLLNSQRSAYYPINIADALDIINSQEGTCAITCIPSAAKAIELLKEEYPILKEKIKYVIGLTYHSTKLSLYTDYYCKKAGKIDGFKDCDYISYRDKQKNINSYKNSGDFVVRSRKHEWRLPGKMKPLDWSIGFLQEFSSNFVDDHFSECADISIMDGWHKKYSQTNGVSLAIVRNSELLSLIQTAKTITSTSVPISTILDSQKHGILFKTVGLSIRLAYFKLFGNNIPQKRVKPSFFFSKPLILLIELIRFFLSTYSHRLYLCLKDDFSKFERVFWKRTYLYLIPYHFLSLLENPIIEFKKIFRFLGR